MFALSNFSNQSSSAGSNNKFSSDQIAISRIICWKPAFLVFRRDWTQSSWTQLTWPAWIFVVPLISDLFSFRSFSKPAQAAPAVWSWESQTLQTLPVQNWTLNTVKESCKEKCGFCRNGFCRKSCWNLSSRNQEYLRTSYKFVKADGQQNVHLCFLLLARPQEIHGRTGGAKRVHT